MRKTTGESVIDPYAPASDAPPQASAVVAQLAQGAMGAAANERERLSDLLDLGLLNTRPEVRFDRITRIATELFDMPVALLSLMEDERQWFKSTCGIDRPEAPRSTAICDYTIRHDACLFVDDLSRDARFSNNPLVADEPHARSYAGIPLHGARGKPVGTLCLIGFNARAFGPREHDLLAELASWVEHEFDLDRLIRAREQRVANLLDRDPSLPVATRTIALERLADVLDERAQAGQQCAVVHLEIANLPQFENTYGAEVVRETVSRWLNALQSAPHEFAYLNRLSDTEFVGALAWQGSVEATCRHCEHRIERAARELQTSSATVAFQVVAGLAVYGEHGSSATELVNKARQAHTSIDATRGVAAYSQLVHQRLLRDQHIRSHFDEALNDGSIHFHWQPLFYNIDGRLSGFEMLARWHDPQVGSIYPDEFIPVAESERSLSRALVRLAFDTAARQIAQWQADAADTALTPHVSVNVPGREFYEPDFHDLVSEALDTHGVCGHHLVLELTERSLIADFEIAARTMDRLKTLGVRIAMDDFGTGYSSIAYLTRLPLSIVKVDKSVVQRLEHDDVARELLRGIVDLAHGQRLQVVAEGVETRAQHEWVKAFGCEYTQGFLLARPETLDRACQRVAAAHAESLPGE